MQASVFIATSLDGFIAREDGRIDWLIGGEEPGAGDAEPYGYRDFFNSIDALVMGRKTFETVLAFDFWPYEEKPVFVLTTHSVAIPEARAGKVSTMSAPPGDVVRKLAAAGYKHLYVDGGKTIQGFLREGLIQELTITRVPILLGSGIPLFGPLPHDIKLRTLESRLFENGFVQTKYQVIA